MLVEALQDLPQVTLVPTMNQNSFSNQNAATS